MNQHNELQQLFEFYRPEVVEMHRRRLVNDSRDLPEYIGTGTESDVFRLMGRSVVKFPTLDKVNRADPGQWIENVTAIYPRGKGVRGLEQIKAYSLRSPTAAIFGAAAGREMRVVEGESREYFPTSHYVGLLATFHAMQERGLATDETSRNMFWDDHRGFTVIDYKLNPGQTLIDKAAYFGSAEMLLECCVTDEIPEYGIRFRETCAKLLGREAVVAINESWEGSGLVVP